MLGVKCQKCGKLFIPPKYVCTECGSALLSKVQLSGEGTLESFTIIRMPPLKFKDQVPYAIGVINLPEGIHVTARLICEDIEKLKMGRKMVYEKEDDVGYWFREVK